MTYALWIVVHLVLPFAIGFVLGRVFGTRARRALRWLSVPSALRMPRGVAQHGSVVYPEKNLDRADARWRGR